MYYFITHKLVRDKIDWYIWHEKIIKNHKIIIDSIVVEVSGDIDDEIRTYNKIFGSLWGYGKYHHMNATDDDDELYYFSKLDDDEDDSDIRLKYSDIDKLIKKMSKIYKDPYSSLIPKEFDEDTGQWTSIDE
jgi:hypothetical protein